MNVVCIVQARVGSTRLPNKVLKTIYDKTVLQLGIDRLKSVKNINKIIIATTVEAGDIAIAEEAEKIGVLCFRGSEQDVLSRYYYAAKEAEADVVVRVTSDCPLIDVEVTDKGVQMYLDNMDKFDYVSNTIERTFPRGLDTEVFSYTALERAFKEAVSQRDREHVTPYIWDNPSLFRIAQYKNSEDHSDLRWTLDTTEDFELINKIYEYLYPEKDIYFTMEDILKLYSNHPELKVINDSIKQKLI